MLKYSISILVCEASVILMAMSVIQYVDKCTTYDPISVSYAVGPLALVAMGLIAAMFEPWRGRLSVRALENRLYGRSR